MTNVADRITVDPEQCGGRPCIRGMPIRVIDILDLLAAGMSWDEVLSDYPELEREDIRAAPTFARKFKFNVVLEALRSPEKSDAEVVLVQPKSDFRAG
jgi:uncharacterized protein (DUF433 family)